MTELNETPDLAAQDTEDTEGHVRIREDADDTEDTEGHFRREDADETDDTEGHFRR
jgi:hypothetical protein